MNGNHNQSHANRRARVLVALKHPDYAPAMLARAKSLASEGAKVWVVHVLERPKHATDATLMEQLETAEAWLRRGLTEAGLGGGALPLVVVGDPAAEILSAVQALDAEILLLGAGTPADVAEARPGTGVGRAVQARAKCAVVFYDLRTDGRIKAP